MIVVIQCAAGKRPNAKHFVTPDLKQVLFVADPQVAPRNPDFMYARPDDLSPFGMTWRQAVIAYNRQDDPEILCLYPAYRLYENRAYVRLVEKFTVTGVYILSAGWGLVPANFLLPHYDITFSPSAEPYKRRRKTDRYDDFRMLPDDTDDDVVFFGGKDYLPLFCELTADVRGKRTVFYNSVQRPEIVGCALKRFETTTRTNWHYECANAFIENKIDAS